MQTATRAFNAALAVRLVALTNADPDTTYILVDVEAAHDAVFSQEMQTPGSTGFAFDMPCVDSANLCFAKFSDTKGYFYYDGIYPGNGGHAVIAKAMRDALLGAGPATQALARSLGLIN